MMPRRPDYPSRWIAVSLQAEIRWIGLRSRRRLRRHAARAHFGIGENSPPPARAIAFTHLEIGWRSEKLLPLPLWEGAGGGVISHGCCVQPLPPTPSRKGRGRVFSNAAMCECRSPQREGKDYLQPTADFGCAATVASGSRSQLSRQEGCCGIRTRACGTSASNS